MNLNRLAALSATISVGAILLIVIAALQPVTWDDRKSEIKKHVEMVAVSMGGDPFTGETAKLVACAAEVIPLAGNKMKCSYDDKLTAGQNIEKCDPDMFGGSIMICTLLNNDLEKVKQLGL